MKKERIRSKQMQRLLAYKARKISFDEVTDDDFDNITELTIDGKLINGRSSEIELNLISLFPNLTSLVISNFEINQDNIDQIAKLQQLESLEIVGCLFNEVDFRRLSKVKLAFIGCEAINFKYPSVETIIVRGSRIDFNYIDFNAATEITIQESHIYNAHSLKNYPQITSVNFDGSTLYSNFEEKISDIEVSENTKYSHKIELDVSDSIR